MKIYSALYNSFYPFSTFFPDAERIHLGVDQVPTDPKGFLVIWGGSDIHPSLYGRENVASYVGAKPSIRDEQEVAMMKAAMKLGLPIVGVCRGAQLGCALAGGILIQDVNGHGTDHSIRTNDGKSMTSSSLHHQMMYPWKTDHKLLAWAEYHGAYVGDENGGLTEDEINGLNGAGSGDDPAKQPEVVWFPKIKCLAVQGHPEFMRSDCAFNNYTHQLIKEYCVPRSSP